jgi:hypothetical protein
LSLQEHFFFVFIQCIVFGKQQKGRQTLGYYIYGNSANDRLPMKVEGSPNAWLHTCFRGARASSHDFFIIR